MPEIWEDPGHECMPWLHPNPMLGWRSVWHTSDLPCPVLCGRENWVEVYSEKGFSKDLIAGSKAMSSHAAVTGGISWAAAFDLG